jgi:hypothetical protein
MVQNGPLCIIFPYLKQVTAAKEALEDYKRHRADDAVNNNRANVYNRETGSFVVRFGFFLGVFGAKIGVFGGF